MSTRRFFVKNSCIALAGLGFAIAGGQWWFLLLLALFFALVYNTVMRREE